MPQGAVAAPAPAPVTARLALIVPLAVERQCLGAASAGSDRIPVEVRQCGPGELNARGAAQAAIAQGATALLAAGVAGALGPGLKSGDVVVPASVVVAGTGRRFETSPEWSRSLRARITVSCRVSDGVLLCVPEVLTSPAAKAAAGRDHGAVACDMESAAVAAVAHDAGIHFAALRVISDSCDDELPDDVGRWVDARGRTKLLPVMRALMAGGGWRRVMTMNAGFRAARHNLRTLSQALSADAWCCPRQ